MVGGYVFGHYSIGTNGAAFPDGDGAQHFRPSAHGDVVFQGGVAFCLGEHLTAQGYPVVQHHTIADVGGFTNDHSHAVVDKKAPTDGGTGVDFHAGEKARELGEDARREFQSAFPQDVGDAVGPDGV